MAVKRKAVVKKSSTPLGRRLKANKKVEEAEVEEEVEEQEEEVDEEVEAEAAEEEEEEEEKEEEESEEDRIAREEKETTAARKKELKAMYLDDLKAVATSKGMEICKKDLMLEMILKHETGERAEIRTHKARVRQVLISKKEELEALGLPELREVSASYGITGQITKPVRIEMIIKQWQEDDGVDNALAKMAHDQRESELTSMDTSALRGLCEAVGIDPFVKELIAERVVRTESKAGRFARPSSEMKALPDDAPTAPKKIDMVDALLANEVQRKKEKELKKQEEEAAESRRKELRAMSVEDLKKQLTSKGLDATGKKEELIEGCFLIKAQEEMLTAKKTELKALGTDKLKTLLELNNIDAGKGKANQMVDLFLAREAAVREEARLYELQVVEALGKQKAELEAKPTAVLKEMCTSKGIKFGVGKEVHIERLLEDARMKGLDEIEKTISAQARDARSKSLSAMDKDALLQLADEMEVPTLVKEVMVDRALAYEAEVGPIVLVNGPAKKKARRS